MKKKIGGIKRSSWLTFRRRLILVRLLLRGPASKQDLLDEIQAEMGEQGYPESADSAFKHDLDSLKSEFGCSVKYQRHTKTFVLQGMGDMALLDLPDTCMEALGFLEASFPPGSDVPEYANIRDFLDHIVKLLPANRQEQYHNQTRTINLHLTGSSSGRIDQRVLTKVKRAISQRRLLEFDYLSTYDIDTPRRHRVAPYAIYFIPEGHGYLDATVLDVSPDGNEPKYAAISYRLNRIISGSVKILPDSLPPERPKSPIYTLCYRLAPIVARRRDVAMLFPNTQIEYHDDGSATITASITNLWQARQVLLRYGSGCKVIEPPELIDMFRETLRGLSDVYADSSD